MAELSDHTLQGLERDPLPAQDAMGFFDVCCGLFWRQMHCLLDPIKPEPNHVFF